MASFLAICTKEVRFLGVAVKSVIGLLTFPNELDIRSFGELRFIVVFLGSPMVPKYNVDDFLESCGVLVMDNPM